MHSRVVHYKDLEKALSVLSGRLVLAGGCFDILHVGHIAFLKAAAKSGDRLVVALEGDEFIGTRKKRHPYHSQKERAEILSALSMVDLVILLPFFKTFKQYAGLVNTVSPHIIAMTQGDPHIKEKKKQASLIGAQAVVVTGHITGYGTRTILEHLNKKTQQKTPA